MAVCRLCGKEITGSFDAHLAASHAKELPQQTSKPPSQHPLNPDGPPPSTHIHDLVAWISASLDWFFGPVIRPVFRLSAWIEELDSHPEKHQRYHQVSSQVMFWTIAVFVVLVIIFAVKSIIEFIF